MPNISKIVLYDEPTVPEIQLDGIKRFIIDTFSIEVESRDNFFQTLNSKYSKEEIGREIASTRIFDLKKQFKRHAPTNAEIQSEIKNASILDTIDTTMAKENTTTLYDGFELQKTITKFLPRDEDTTDIMHVIFTNRLVCTFDHDDYRYHARALIGANPTIISTSGIIEAPAKPKQYYIDMIACYSKKRMQEINSKYKGEFLEYHDPRLGDVVKGYILQAIVYYYTEESFCKDKECRLFNAHWQEDLLYIQITSKKLCKKHSDIIKRLKNKSCAN